jgi:hypothetical protein
LHTEPLGEQHDRAAFSCGDAEMDAYVHTHLRQDTSKGVAVCHVLCEPGSPEILGFYTVNATSVALTSLPDDLKRRLPRYPAVPAILIGRLGVSVNRQHQGLGPDLVFNTMERTLLVAEHVGVAGLVVDAENDGLVSWYVDLGFIQIAPASRRLFLPIQKIRSILTPPEAGDDT